MLKVTNTLEKYDKEEICNVVEMYQPKGAQIEALDMLERSREEGFDKVLVVAATGIGKTFLAAFDCKEFKGDIVFASVQTLGKKEYLNEEYLSKDYFDYVVIDGAVILGLN